MPTQIAQAGTVGLACGGNRALRQACDLELRKGLRDIGEQPRTLGRRRRAEKPDRGRELAVPVADRRIDLIGPMDQKDRGDDQVNGDDRCDHECGDLPADPVQVEKAEQVHGQPSLATALTVGVNM